MLLSRKAGWSHHPKYSTFIATSTWVNPSYYKHLYCCLPCHWPTAQWDCSPIQSGLSRWPVLAHHRRMACLCLGWHWIWATCTQWRRTFQGGSSWCARTGSWYGEGGTPWNPQVIWRHCYLLMDNEFSLSNGNSLHSLSVCLVFKSFC